MKGKLDWTKDEALDIAAKCWNAGGGYYSPEIKRLEEGRDLDVLSNQILNTYCKIMDEKKNSHLWNPHRGKTRTVSLVTLILVAPLSIFLAYIILAFRVAIKIANKML